MAFSQSKLILSKCYFIKLDGVRQTISLTKKTVNTSLKGYSSNRTRDFPQHLLKHMPPAEILSSMTILNHGPNNVE